MIVLGGIDDLHKAIGRLGRARGRGRWVWYLNRTWAHRVKYNMTDHADCVWWNRFTEVR